MSIFDEANQDSYRGSFAEGSEGPKLGFLDAFSAAWDAQAKVHSLLAVEQGLRSVEQEQNKRIREAGLRPPKSLDDSEDVGTGPFGGAQFKQGRYSAAAQSIVDGGGWYTDEMVNERDLHLKKLQADRPDLGVLTYADMFKKVQTDAQEVEKRSTGPVTAMGEVGRFAGGMIGGMDPRSDPINAALLPVGGGGGVLGRAAVQGLAQAGGEAANMAVSNPENLLLGHERSFGEDAARLGMAAVGGVGAEFLTTGVGAAIRKARTGKWFSDVPLPKDLPARPDTAPPATIEHIGEVPPSVPAGRPLHEYPSWEAFAEAHGEHPVVYGATREARTRFAADLDHVSAELNRWDGPAPWEVRPPETMTALPRGVEPGTQIDVGKPYQRYIDNLETVDDIARRVDPDLFRVYDRLAEERKAASEQAQADPNRVFDPGTPQGDAHMALRKSIQDIDHKMRDLAPLVSRAYAAAEKEWRTTPIDHGTIDFLKRLEETGFRYREPAEPHHADAEFVRPGSPDIPKMREAKSFVDWFKGSKALDPEGQPAIVYHGTLEAFDHFDLEQGGKATGAPSAKEGIFFASDTEVANGYAKPYDAYADGTGPLDNLVRVIDKLTLGYYKKFNEAVLMLFGGGGLDKMGAPNIRPAYLKMHDPLVIDFKGKDYREESYYDAIRRAKAAGNDGVIFKNTYDPGFDGVQSHPADIFVVFSPDQVKAFSERFESAPSLTEQPLRVQDGKALDQPQRRTVNDTVPLANLAPEVDKRVGPLADAAERVHQNVEHAIEMQDIKVEGFVKSAEKTAKLETKDVAAAIEAAQAKVDAATERVRTAHAEGMEAAREAVAKAAKELDKLQFVTFPDGRKLSLDDDTVPFVSRDGRVEDMSVRDFLREMAKDQEALQSVVTCSRPS